MFVDDRQKHLQQLDWSRPRVSSPDFQMCPNFKSSKFPPNFLVKIPNEMSGLAGVQQSVNTLSCWNLPFWVQPSMAHILSPQSEDTKAQGHPYLTRIDQADSVTIQETRVDFYNIVPIQYLLKHSLVLWNNMVYKWQTAECHIVTIMIYWVTFGVLLPSKSPHWLSKLVVSSILDSLRFS